MLRMMLAFLLVAIATYWGILYTYYLRPHAPEIDLSADSVGRQDLSIPGEPFTLRSPDNALPGTVKEVEGQVTIRKRAFVSPRSATTNDTLVDGESLVTTNNGSALLSIAEKGQLSVLPDTQITIINALEASYLLTLQGRIDLQLADTEQAVVRTQGVLVQLNGATASIDSDLDLGRVEIEMQAGDATIAYLDSSYETDVYQLGEGEQATIQGGVFERLTSKEGNDL